MNPQIEELACLYVLDRLEPGERASFEARLQHDPQLAAFLRETESALDQGIRSLPEVEPPGGLLAQIEARIDLDAAIEASGPCSRERQRVDSAADAGPARDPESGTGSLPAVAPARRQVPPVVQEDSPDMGETPMPRSSADLLSWSLWGPIARWGIAALFVVGFGTLAVQFLRRAPAGTGRPFVIIVGLDSLRSTRSELPLQKLPPDVDESFVQLAALAERFWEKPEDLPAKLRAIGESMRGYALFDPASSQGFIAVQRLPVIGRGQRYRLWMLDIASGRTREAGVLPPTGSARGLYSFSIGPNFDAKQGNLDFFVTAEDSEAPESARPSGKVVLGGQRTF
jgi:anti-sigma-K factor RskA